MFELFKKNNAAFSRWLGLLLVLFVFYGTTIEAAHRHGVATSTSIHAGYSIEPDSGSDISTTKPGCNDCLICQLHQNFSATLISVKPDAQQITRVTHSRRLDPISIRSLVTNPSPGRAPPQAN
jgi:hypothetical protein